MDMNTLTHVLAVDIGGTHMRLGLIDAQARLIGQITDVRVPFGATGSADAGRRSRDCHDRCIGGRRDLR